MNKNEKLASVGAGIHIFTSDQHPFGTDAILLADFASPKKNDIACDLGSGCGIIPFLWARSEAPGHITAVEMQQNAVALMQKSVSHNRLAQRVSVVQGDLREPENLGIQLQSFSLVTMNPPYTAPGAGLPSADTSQKIARHAFTCTTDNVMRCANKLLRFGGRICLCQKPEHLPDLMWKMRENGMEPKRLRFVTGKQGKAPYLVLLEGRKGAGKELKVLPELFVQNEDGSWSEEMLRIYGEYGDGTKK